VCAAWSLGLHDVTSLQEIDLAFVGFHRVKRALRLNIYTHITSDKISKEFLSLSSILIIFGGDALIVVDFS